MKYPIHISLSPNTESEDARTALETLVTPTRWRDEQVLEAAEGLLSAQLNRQSVVLTSSGRTALFYLLQAHGVTAGDEVILQAFTCSVVPAAITAAGARPVYVDIDAKTYNLNPAAIEAKITPQTKAIIVQHTFGIPADLAAIQALAARHHLLIIEDCAHAFGAIYHGQPVSTFGDSAFLSFGRDKLVSTVFGGAVTSLDTTVMEQLRRRLQNLPLPPTGWIIQQLLHPLLVHGLLPWYFEASVGKVALVLLQKLGLLSKAVTSEEKKNRLPHHASYAFSPALGHLLVRQLKVYDANLARRRAIARRYQEALQSVSGITLPAVLPNTDPAWLRFPLQVAEPERLHERARQFDMILGDWYDTPLAPRDVEPQSFHYVPGSCPEAEAVAQHVINLPTYPRLTDEQVDRIISFVKTNV
jgi:perosamine synthetase